MSGTPPLRRRAPGGPRGPASARRSRRAVAAAVLVVLAPGVQAGCETTVVVVPVDRVTLSPSSTTLLEGESVTLAAVAHGPTGAPLSGREVEWSSTRPSVASVDDGGTVEAVGPGDAVIRAAIEGRTAEAAVNVLAGPALALEPPAVVLEAVAGASSPPEVVTVRNDGNGEISGLSASVAYADGGPSGWLGASLSSTVAPASLALQASAAELEPGRYDAAVTVEADGGLSSRVEVALEVDEAPPSIEVDPPDLALNAPEGGELRPQIVRVTNAGGGVLDGLAVEVRYDEGPPGWLTAGLASPVAPTDLTLSASTDGLAPGVYRATVLVSSPAAQSDVAIPVDFRITAGARLP